MEQELNQAGEAQEQTASVATSPEEKVTSQRTEEEFRKMQSMKDKAESALQSVQSELQQLREERERQRVEARQKEIAALEGDSDGQALIRRKHQAEDELRRAQEQRTKEEEAVQRKYDQAGDLAKQYNLSLADARDLLAASTPKEMELMAKLKAAEQSGVQGKTSTFTPDSGVSDAGGRRTWSQDEVAAMTGEEYAKNSAEIEKAWREGRIKQ